MPARRPARPWTSLALVASAATAYMVLTNGIPAMPSRDGDDGSNLAFTGTIMAENSELLLKNILQDDYPEKSIHSYFSPARLASASRNEDKENFDKMKAAFDACLDEGKARDLGDEPLNRILDEIKKSVPSWRRSGYVKDTVLLLAKQGIAALIDSGTGADDRDPDSVVVTVSPPWSFGLPSKERYEDDTLLEKYRNMTVNVLGAFYPDADKDVFSKVVDFEKKLAAVSPSTEDRLNVTKYYNPMVIDEAAALVPELEIQALISELAPKDVVVERVIVASPEYLDALSGILKDTEKDVLEAYFSWKAIQSLSSYVESDSVKPYKRFRNELTGKEPDSAPDRWRTCVRHVDGGLGWILSRFFIERAFSAQAKEFGDTIIKDIKTEFVKKLNTIEWMDDETTKKAIDKVHNIIQKIGYPTDSPDILNPSKLRGYYKSVDVSSSAFFDNTISMRKFEVGLSWSALGKPVDRDEWGMTASTFPVFNVDTPAYLSYGAFGAVAGHELSHAFDSTGRHYDQNGNYSDWWSEGTVKAFNERAQCFVDQYADYTIPGLDGKPLHVNGWLTLGENIADAGGLSAAFQAWKSRTEDREDQDLPGLSFFSHDQLFFVNYANWWCGKTRKDSAVDSIYTDPHSPKWARVLGTMANSREFRESFQCKDKKPTCELW
ncbi:unnamed protein product [Parascedosporium putredinis]|uniref:Endothelin-converting enzyme 1 n=1 Tax=Parascedosporium putredinis TaxID=1442378 RepID=A0A9P1GYP5_9PEZI|nr:unnamed protein product [Parascedosporium putredinis]CAI7990140.1 unnamed protein product [Parascedosporium putredinis]